MAGLMHVHSHVFCIADWPSGATKPQSWAAQPPDQTDAGQSAPRRAWRRRAKLGWHAGLCLARQGRAGASWAGQPPSLERRSLTWPSPAQRGVVVQQLRAAEAFGLIEHDIFWNV